MHRPRKGHPREPESDLERKFRGPNVTGLPDLLKLTIDKLEAKERAGTLDAGDRAELEQARAEKAELARLVAEAEKRKPR